MQALDTAWFSSTDSEILRPDRLMEQTDMGGTADKNYAGPYDFLFYRDDADNVAGGSPFLQEYSQDYIPFDRPINTSKNGILSQIYFLCI